MASMTEKLRAMNLYQAQMVKGGRPIHTDVSAGKLLGVSAHTISSIRKALDIPPKQGGFVGSSRERGGIRDQRVAELRSYSKDGICIHPDPELARRMGISVSYVRAMRAGEGLGVCRDVPAKTSQIEELTQRLNALEEWCRTELEYGV